MSLEQLVNLVADSGMLALPPSDGVTERYTLKDLGSRMWTQVGVIPHDKRPEWFEGLVDTQKAALITTLRERGFSTAVIARDYGIDPMDVQRTFNRHVDKLGGQVVNIRLDTIVGQLQLAAERASEGAMDKDDWATYWRVHKELIQQLQSIGIVDKAVHKMEITHTFDEQSKIEIDRILEIERKERARDEELKRVEVREIEHIEETNVEPATSSMAEPYEDD